MAVVSVNVVPPRWFRPNTTVPDAGARTVVPRGAKMSVPSWNRPPSSRGKPQSFMNDDPGTGHRRSGPTDPAERDPLGRRDGARDRVDPGMTTVWPGRIRLLEVMWFAFSSAESDTPWSSAIPERVSPSSTV